MVCAATWQTNPRSEFVFVEVDFYIGILTCGQRLEIKLRRDHILHDSFRAFHGKSTEELLRKTRVEFVGEVGIDSGGLSQEWYLMLSRELLKPSYCLFVKQQGETYHVDPRSKLNEEHVAYFCFAGQILAKAILDRKIVGMHLSRALLKVSSETGRTSGLRSNEYCMQLTKNCGKYVLLYMQRLLLASLSH